MGLTPGNSKYPCFICQFDTRDDEKLKYTKKYKERLEYVIKEFGVKFNPLIKKEKIIIPPLHIKLGLFTKFLKTININAINYLNDNLFTKLSEDKLDNGILNGPDINKLINDKNFRLKLSPLELNCFDNLINFVNGFLGNVREKNYKQLVNRLKKSFKELNVTVSPKMHYVFNHLDSFAIRCGGYSDEQGEKVHQLIKFFQKNYKGKNSLGILTDYHWSIKDEQDVKLLGRKNQKTFM